MKKIILSDNFKSLGKDVLFLILILLLSWVLSYPFGEFELWFFNQNGGGGWWDVTALVGLPIAHIFFTALIFTAFGSKWKYWWIIITVIPSIYLEWNMLKDYIYFPVALGLIGWALGFGLQKLVVKFKNGS